MPQYIRFDAAGGNAVLVEVEGEEASSEHGVVKAGLKDKMKEAVVLAQSTFEDALRRAVQCNAEAFRHAVKGLEEPPDEAEMTFSLKATGELGNVAVGKLGAGANYTIKLVWKAASRDRS